MEPQICEARDQSSFSEAVTKEMQAENCIPHAN